jgi:hypothetical protein
MFYILYPPSIRTQKMHEAIEVLSMLPFQIKYTIKDTVYNESF